MKASPIRVYNFIEAHQEKDDDRLIALCKRKFMGSSLADDQWRDILKTTRGSLEREKNEKNDVLSSDSSSNS
jgi:hypothetical protein